MKSISYKNTFLAILLLASLTQCKPDLAGKRPWDEDEIGSNSGQKRVKLEKEPAAPTTTPSSTADLSIGKKEHLDTELVDYTPPTTLTADLSSPNTPIKAELTQERNISLGMQNLLMLATAYARYNQNIELQQGHGKNHNLQRHKEEVSISPTTLDFSQFPKDLFYNILSYLAPEEINYIIKNVSKYFYQHTTGYDRPGIIGYYNKPTIDVPIAQLGLNNRELNLQHIIPEILINRPSFFYQQIGTLRIDLNTLILLANTLPAITEHQQVITNLNNLVRRLACVIDKYKAYELIKNDQEVPDECFEDMGKILRDTDKKIAKLLRYRIVGEAEKSGSKLSGDDLIKFIVPYSMNLAHTKSLDNQFGSQKPTNSLISLPHVNTLRIADSKIHIDETTLLTTILTHMSGSLHTLDLNGLTTPYEVRVSRLVKSLPAKIKKLSLKESSGISKEEVGEIPPILKNASLESLDLRNYLQREANEVEIVEYFNNLPFNLKKLRVSNCQLTTGRMAKIASSLKHHTSLQSLYIDSNSLGDEGATILFNNLPFHLKKLDVSKINFTSVGIANIDNLLKHHTSLKSLNVSYNKLGDEGAIKLAENLPPQLKHLDLRGCGISAEGAIKIAKALKASSSKLYSLDLTDNDFSGFSEEGGREFAKSLPHDLQHLILEHNKMGGMGELVKFVEILKHVNIHTLKLRADTLTTEGIADLVKNLPPSLHELNFSGTMENAAAITIAQTLKSTHSKLHTLRIPSRYVIRVTKRGYMDKKIDKAFNTRILKIAQDLEGSNIREVDLRDEHPKITTCQQIQLVQKYPRIKWLF